MVTQKLKNAVKNRIDAARGITKADVKQFAKDCIPTLLCLGVYMLPSAVGLANTASDVKITPLQKPLETITSALTGPIPILVTGGGIALGGMAWAMGWEQQALMRGVKVAGGGAIAMAAGEFMKSTINTGKDLSGILF
ncbi:TrbC/VirB2 family protein [uncultured Selenomonas sp.]|uniref:TrbC/VirB2 family protein n=1 Tax=uncultured Selenomonas sp. TaxID=159275 RepID=UPI0028D29B55|nr:TrbC/VirB2 family protein [uncultured Selenomonas sp.]